MLVVMAKIHHERQKGRTENEELNELLTRKIKTYFAYFPEIKADLFKKAAVKATGFLKHKVLEDRGVRLMH